MIFFMDQSFRVIIRKQLGITCGDHCRRRFHRKVLNRCLLLSVKERNSFGHRRKEPSRIRHCCVKERSNLNQTVTGQSNWNQNGKEWNNQENRISTAWSNYECLRFPKVLSCCGSLSWRVPGCCVG